MGKLMLFFAIMIIPTFKETQLKNVRVQRAYNEKEEIVKGYFANSKIKYSGFNLFLRVFKQESIVEVWVREAGNNIHTLLHTYDFCASSGTIGPKRKEGDLQIPEGVYSIDHFNPQSNFYLSLGINYPNASDRILSDKANPGSNIYLHGNCVTIGCIPLTDDKIKELYILAVEARNNGQQKIPVHIFPAKLSDSQLILLKKEFPSHADFWKNLQGVYTDFEKTKKLKVIRVSGNGDYVF
ncbi:MAG: hypothetical protein C0490_10815 [Marivirga sp.]|nr:hypothetical protein [Marivirga sp.]